ncbi:hypothetical protein C8R43DRAFT_1070446 [Mycena crocata]|nr:hypothetical protein C8R43DRAFT_1070446 [Mycena crocata]
MHIISTINAKTQSREDVPVVLVTLGDKRKFLPRAETYKEMQRLVRYNYGIESSSTALQFEVSSWDVCGGENVEVTEDAYGILGPLLDIVSVVVVELGRNRAMPTPSETDPPRVDDEIEEERTVHADLTHSALFANGSLPRRAATHAPKVESEEEQIPTEEDDEPEVRVKEEPASPVAANSRSAIGQYDLASESSHQAVSDPDAQFNVFVSGPEPEHRREFLTRGRHLVRKVLSGVCKTYKLDVDHAKLLLCVSMPDEDGNMEVHRFECDQEETVLCAGITPNSKLIVIVDHEKSTID